MSSTLQMNVKNAFATVVSYLYNRAEQEPRKESDDNQKITEWSSDSSGLGAYSKTLDLDSAAFSSFAATVHDSLRMEENSSLSSNNDFLNSTTSTQINGSNVLEISLMLPGSAVPPPSGGFRSTKIFIDLVVILIFLLLSWHFLKSWWKSRNLQASYDPFSELGSLPLPPGDFGLPLIGETFSWMKQGAEFNSIRRNKYGNVFKTNIIGSPMVRVSGQEFVREVLKGEHDKVTTLWPENVRKILGENGLVNTIGAAHRSKRKIIQKAFTSSALNGYIPILSENAKRNVQAMGDSKHPKIYQKSLKLTFDLAASALLGLDIGKIGGTDIVDTFHSLVSNIFSIPLRIPGFGFCKAMKARKKLLDLLQDHIHKKKTNLKTELDQADGANKNKETAAFDIYIRELLRQDMQVRNENAMKDINNNKSVEGTEKEDSEPLTDFALKEMAMELMFAGYFTSASAFTSCILELSKNPQVFKELEEELFLHGLLKEEASSNEKNVEINLQLIHKLTYLEKVLKETLRMRPPTLGGYRKARRTFQLGKYRIPKGWTVVYNIRDTHDFEYEDTDKFDPERFAPGNNGDEKHKFVAFGGGPRMCIGQEFARLAIKISLIEMFRTYKGWKPVSNGLPKMNAIPTLHPADGFPCVLDPRKEYGIVSR